MAKMIVVCAGSANTRFDRQYYTTEHFALTRECWGRYGLEAVDAFFPDGEGDGWLSIGVYRFGSTNDIDVALNAPEMERVMADVKNFTDATIVMRDIFSPM